VGLGLEFRLFQILLRRGWLLVAIIVVVIAGSATDFCSRTVYQGHDGMVRNPAAFDAMIVNHIA
jgi:hypothetical protein